MLTTTIEVYKVNKKLSRSIHPAKWLYLFLIGFFCIVVISLMIFNFFLNSGGLNSFLGVVYSVFLFDMIAIIVRLQKRAYIEPYQLNIFPISKWKKFLFHFVIVLLDYKSLIYLSSMVCFIFFFIQHSLYTGAVLSMIVWFLLLGTILTWTAVLYSLFGKYLDRMSNNIQYIGLFFIVILTGMQEFIDDFILKIPVLKHAGTALYGLWTNNPQIVWENLSILLGSLGLPLILLFGISRFEWNQ
ncbi:MAG: hypothetical protein GVY20_09735 [Bacteroidetes bacterium]|jgi:hypothetical protein|nr:hypothetical protein [Bacteroidota bacterium]